LNDEKIMGKYKNSLFQNIINVTIAGTRMIAHCNSEFTKSSIGEAYAKGNDALLLIGPEGDFSKEEISAATSSGYLSVHLGSSRLRSETAGIAACHSIYFINQ
jgi:16S rRNA (uracil1498-N3)-methyltransferase